VFNLYGNERLTEWKNIRDNIEIDSQPLEIVADLWARAPFVNPYLNPKDSSTWPDPWHLVLGDRLDDLAITLGMLYTVKLTQRFMATPCEIHMSIPFKKQEPRFHLLIDNKFILNFEPRKVVGVDAVNIETEIIWQGNSLK
jgi:hypothetical protein